MAETDPISPNSIEQAHPADSWAEGYPRYDSRRLQRGQACFNEAVERGNDDVSFDFRFSALRMKKGLI